MTAAPAALRNWLPLAGAALFALAGIAGVLHHEMWRDELQVWLIGRDSHSLTEFYHNIGTETHPVLWNFLVFLLARVFTSPLSMAFLNLGFAVAAVFLILKKAPLSGLHRSLFAAGYWMLYEYTVIARCYALEMFLLIAIVLLWNAEKRSVWKLAVLLILLANTNLLGTIFAAGFGLIWLLELLQKESVRWNSPAAAWAGLAGVALGAFAGLAEVYRQYDASGTAGLLSQTAPPKDATWIASQIGLIFKSWFPLPDAGSSTVWNSHFTDAAGAQAQAWMTGCAAIVLLLFAFFVLRPSFKVWIFYIVVSVLLLVLFAFFWPGSMRHHGHFFLAFVIAMMLAGRDSLRGIAYHVLTAVLAVQCAAGGWLWYTDFTRTFSNASAVASSSVLQQAAKDHTLISGSYDFSCSAINTWKTGTIWYPESGKEGTFIFWYPNRKDSPRPDWAIARTLSKTEGEKFSRCILLLTERFNKDLEYKGNSLEKNPGEVIELERGFSMRLLEHHTGAMVQDENYYVWEITQSGNL